ncbi:MAG: polyphenol oxidase family protein, partial [Verrucomicrobiota bacterium]|nr:polyphenol oxidase family protein [Verrucomicrobiota bacterium]
LSQIRHGFIGRAPGIDVAIERAQALQRLELHHAAARRALGLGDRPPVTAEQVHGNRVAVVQSPAENFFPGVDGFITACPEVCLGIYVADCCAVYLVEPGRRVIALLHSGKKGSELGITTIALERMVREFGCDPARVIAQLSPSIRPPMYEVDFAAQIVRQCRAAGVRQVFDCGTCTAAHPDRYYSYRASRGKTGRMLALLGLEAACISHQP